MRPVEVTSYYWSAGTQALHKRGWFHHFVVLPGFASFNVAAGVVEATHSEVQAVVEYDDGTVQTVELSNVKFLQGELDRRDA